jgi:hypothetical protein
MIIEQVQGLNANEVLSEVMTKGAFDIRKGVKSLWDM